MDIRQRLLARYVSTHSSVADAAAGLERRRPYLDRLVRDHFPSDRSARILDLGCGHGAILWAAARAGYTQLAGVDASPEQVAAAQRLNIPGVRLGDLMETLAAAPDASLDAVVLFDLFHYFPPEQQAAIGNQTGGRVGFFLDVENFQEDIERMIAAGARVIDGPRTEEYSTVAVVRDMYGNKWDVIRRSS